MTAEKFFERQIEKARRSLEKADRRGDEGAVTGLRKKLGYYREAVRALREYDALRAERDAAVADLYLARHCDTCAKGDVDCQWGLYMGECSGFPEEANTPYRWRGEGAETKC